MKQTSMKVLTLLTALLILLSGVMTAFAGGGNGDGTGGGKDKPLELASSSIANGADNVSQNPEIVLTFTKNVVHFTVRDNNQKCFSMTDSSGKAVPINVIMGDDQVDPSIKRIVTIKPQSSLIPGETYLLKIGGDITSKSGVSIGKDSYIAFTVAGEAPTTTTKPTTTKPTTTKPTTTKPTTTKPTTTKPKPTKPATTKPTTTTAAATTTTSATTVTTTVVTVTAVSTQTVSAATASTDETQEVVIDISEFETEPTVTELQEIETEAPETTPATAAAQTTAATTAAQKNTKTNGQNPIPYVITGGIIMIALIAVVLFIEKKK